MEDIILWNVQQRQSPYTRQSGNHSCVAKISFTYLNIIKTENKRKSLIDFFEIERLCLFLATLFLPNFHSLFTFQGRRVKTFPHQCLSTGVKDRIDTVKRMLIFGNGQQWGPPSLRILLCRCLRWENERLSCFQSWKAWVSDLWLQVFLLLGCFFPILLSLVSGCCTGSPFFQLLSPHPTRSNQSSPAMDTVFSGRSTLSVLFRNHLL